LVGMVVRGGTHVISICSEAMQRRRRHAQPVPVHLPSPVSGGWPAGRVLWTGYSDGGGGARRDAMLSSVQMT